MDKKTRTEIEQYVIKYMAELDTSGINAKRWQERFKAMDDKAFVVWIEELKTHESIIDIESPNMSPVQHDINRLVECSKKLNVELFTQLKLWDEPTQSYYRTSKKYIMLKLPLRRMAQFLDHKLSVPEGDSKIDLLSGQVMKPDQANSISQVEVQSLYARGLKATILELIKYRGGDTSAFAEYKRSLEETGRCSIGKDTNSITRSVVVLDVFFSGMQLESNASGL